MTAVEAYECDHAFAGMIDAWVADRRCGMPLADRCTELDMPAAAECCLWCATVPNRRVTGSPEAHGAFPSDGAGMFRWYWFSENSRTDDSEWNLRTRAYYLPTGKTLETNYSRNSFETARDAILWLLDNWRVSVPSAGA